MKLFLQIVLPIAVFAAAAATFIYLTYSPPIPARVAMELPALLVDIEETRREPVRFYVYSQGTVIPRVSTNLVAQVQGQVTYTSPSLVEGGFFKKGEVLIEIEKKIYEARVVIALANVTKAQTHVDNQKALAAYELEVWERNLSQEADTGQNTQPPTPWGLSQALADLDAENSRLIEAQDNLKKTVIKAPYDGMITDKNVDIGQVVGGQSPLASIVAIDFARVRLPLTLQDLIFLDIPSVASETMDISVELETRFEDHVAKTWRGSIIRTEGVLDPQSRVIYVVAHVEDPYNLKGNATDVLRIGTFVNAKIEGIDGGELFVIPRHAIQRNSILWVLDKEDKIYPTEVEIERADQDYAYISDGLVNGDRYVTTPIEQPLPGMKVRFYE